MGGYSWTQFNFIFSACILLSPALARHRTQSTSRAHEVNQVQEDVRFLAWLPDWWAPEERDWKRSAPSTKNDTLEYYGQDKEDKVAMTYYFHEREGLMYLEMGSYDGVIFSNTLSFQKFKNSRGVLIEANPVSYAKLVQNRPNDIDVNVAVCDTFQTVHFYPGLGDNPAVGGIIEFMPEGFKQRWGAADSSAQPIPCVPLSNILSKLNIAHVDFWSLDVEGAELKVLQTVDWQSFSADVIVVEADGHDPAKDQAVLDLLLQNGYIFDGRVQRNNWLHHSSFNPSQDPATRA